MYFHSLMMCVNARLGVYSHVFNQNPPLFVPLSDSVFLLVVVILLLVKIHSSYVHTSHGSWMILYVAK